MPPAYLPLTCACCEDIAKMSRHPSVKWAQRSDKLFITVELPDAQDVKLNLEPEGKIFFSATSGPDKIPYEVDLDLLEKVNVEESKCNVGSRIINCIVKKAENKWWSRLQKQPGKAPIFLAVDWDKWVDEDEEKVGATSGMEDFDFSKLGVGDDEGLDEAAADMDDDDGSDTGDENVGEAPSAEKKAEASEESRVEKSSASGEQDTKKT